MGLLLDKAIEQNNNYNTSYKNKNDYFKLSVIITAYNPKHLQDVLNHLEKLDGIYEVVVVYDNPLNDETQIIKDYPFKFKVIKHDNNYYVSAARNTGIYYSTGDVLLFLDQDMILSPYYIPNMNNILSANPNSIISGFRDTLNFEEIPMLENWRESDYNKEWRIKTQVLNNFVDLTALGCGSIDNNVLNPQNLCIFKDTNEWRNFGVCREKTIGFWDISSMVVGHSISIKKQDCIKIGGFSENFVGWGGEDTAFGFMGFANGLKIIPNLVGSYHIKHEIYANSEKEKLIQLKENILRYRKWISEIDESPKIDFDNCKKRSKLVYKN